MAPTNQTKNGFDHSPVINIAAILISLGIGVLILRQLASFLQPLLLAVFFFYIGDPIAKSLTKRGVPTFIAFLVPMILGIFFFFILGWVIWAHIDELAAQLPSYRQRLQGTVQAALAWLFENLPVLGDKLRSVWSGRTLPLNRLEGPIRAIVGNFFGFISFALLVIFFLIFIIQEAATLPRRLEEAYGAQRSKRIINIGTRINKGIIGYVYVKGLASFLVSVLSTITMVSFQLDLALLWGVLVFFGNFVPYIGSAMAVVFPIIIALLQFTSVGSIVALAILLVGCQILVGNYLEPKFAGKQLNLSPLVVLLSLAFWGWLWGIIGLILSIPIMVSIKFILENIPATQDIAIMMSHASKKR